MVQRVADIVVEYLESIGVQKLFAVSGGGAIFLCDAVAKAKKLEYVCCHHEQAVGMAAEAYTRVNGDLGVSLVTSGPGGTNCITGTAGSWLDSVPNLVLSGQVFYQQTIQETGLRQMGIQEINIIDIVKPFCKYAKMVTVPEDIVYELEKAIHIAKSGRPGPVWLDIPGDVQNAKIDPSTLRRFKVPEVSAEETAKSSELPKQVATVVDWLVSADRPLLHFGQGVKIAGVVEDVMALVEEFKLPFATTRNANDICGWDHDLLVGRPGTFAQRGANFAVQNSGFYLAIGARLSLSQTGYRSHDYARNAKTVLVDVDPQELGKTSLRMDLRICADAGEFVRELGKQLRANRDQMLMKNAARDEWREACRNWKKNYPVCLPEYADLPDKVNSYYFIDLLSDHATPDDIIVSDMGFAFQNLHQAFRTKSGQRMFTNGGMAAMGWGLPAAVGAAVAGGGRRVLCLLGDGGFMMNLQEAATVMHNRLPIKMFLLNNNGYLTIRQTQELGFEGRYMGSSPDSGIDFPNFKLIAEAHKFPYYCFTDHDQLRKQLGDFLAIDGPAFCELIMDENQVQGPKAVNRRNQDGSINPTPFEDLHPFLDPAEVKANLLPGSKPFGS